MRINLTVTEVVYDTEAGAMAGPSDIELVTIEGQTYLIAAGEAEGGLTSFLISADGSLSLASEILPNAGSGTLGLRDITVGQNNAEVFLFTGAMADNNQVRYTIGADGGLTVGESYSDAAGTYAQWDVVQMVSTDSATYLYASIWGQPGLLRFELDGNNLLTGGTYFPDNADIYLGDVTAIHGAKLHGQDFLFIASGIDAGMQSYRVLPDGSLDLIDTVAPAEGGISGATEIVSAEVDGRAFVVLAASGTDQLLVYRVSAGGNLKLVDAVIDTNDTRFAGASALEVIEFEGRTLIAVGGSDDGITIFELNGKGWLTELATLADDNGTALADITAIKADIVDGILHLFASSATEDGVTHMTIDLVNGANVIEGGAVADILHGTAGDDTIYGYGHKDELYGEGGDDRLIDGRGSDKMWGGDGADIFVFIPDGREDQIMDFQIGIDRIDLSQFSGIYDYSELAITSTEDGAVITFEEDVFTIHSIDGSPLSADDFAQTDFVF